MTLFDEEFEQMAIDRLVLANYLEFHHNSNSSFQNNINL